MSVFVTTHNTPLPHFFYLFQIKHLHLLLFHLLEYFVTVSILCYHVNDKMLPIVVIRLVTKYHIFWFVFSPRKVRLDGHVTNICPIIKTEYSPFSGSISVAKNEKGMLISQVFKIIVGLVRLRGFAKFNPSQPPPARWRS